ncbi:hypothetical protein D046_3132, partial [Vibrio parahaemolyticus V-223/04]
MLVFLHS